MNRLGQSLIGLNVGRQYADGLALTQCQHLVDALRKILREAEDAEIRATLLLQLGCFLNCLGPLLIKPLQDLRGGTLLTSQ